MQIVIPLFPLVTALDAVGPYEVLQRVPELDVRFAGVERGSVRSEYGVLGLDVDATFDEVPAPDVVVVPGGPDVSGQFDGPLHDWLRRVHPHTRYTTSVCTGALILGAAGLLHGLDATTHWAALGELEQYGARPVKRRVVEQLDHRIVTAAGVSSGIDMALRLIAILVDDVAAQAAQLITEYDPQPPFDAGSPERATPDVRERADEYMNRPLATTP